MGNMGDDVFSVCSWLNLATGIPTETFRAPDEFQRPLWIVEEPSRTAEPRRADVYREKATMNVVLMAMDDNQLTDVSLLIRQSLADRGWILPLYSADKQQVGFLRECRLTMYKPNGFDRSIELVYTAYIPYTPMEYDPLEVIHRRYDETLRKGDKMYGSRKIKGN